MGDKYLIFGLVTDCLIPLPEAFPARPDAATDVTIICGTAGEGFQTDDSFKQAREKRYWWQGMQAENRMIFNCQAGLFEIRDGNTIIMQLYPDADNELAKIFLLGSAMGAIQVQRGRIPVHGGAIFTSNGAVIITGGQGAGKSTMTSAFVHNGYPYLTDDVSSVSFEDDNAIIFPAYPQRKLVRDACASLGYTPDDLILVDSGRDKFAVRDKENWCMEPTRLWAIAELFPIGKDEVVSVSRVKGRDMLDCVARNLYRLWMHMPDGGMKPGVFKKILNIAGQTEVYRVGVPRDIGNIAGIAQDIASELKI